MDILKSHFNDDEFLQVEEKINNDPSFREKYEKIKNNPDYKLTKLEEKISRTQETFEKRFESFKKVVLEAEEQASKSISDNLKQNINDTVKKEKDKIESELRQKAEKFLPFWIWTWLFDKAKDLLEPTWEKNWFMSKIWIWLWWVILSILWLKKWYDKLTQNSQDQIKPENLKKESEIIKPDKKTTWNENNENVTLEQKEINPQKKQEFYYKSWKILIKNLLDEQFTPKDNFWIITDKLQDIKYSELKNLSFLDFDKNNKWFIKENFEKTKSNLLWDEMVVLYDNILSKQNIEKLLKNPKTKESLLKLWIDNFENFSWKNLKIKELFTIFALVVSSITLSWISLMPWIWKNVFDKILAFKSDMPWFEDIKEDLKQAEADFEKNVISKETITEIISISNISENLSFAWKIDKFESITNQEKVLQLLEFRTYLVNEVLKKEKYNLWKIELIKRNISFKDLLELFIILKWQKVEANEMKSCLVYTWIIKLLDKWNDSWAYIKDITEHTVKSNSEILNKQEQSLLKIILKKMIDKTWLDNLQNNAKTAMDAWIETIEDSPEIIAWLAWIIAVLAFTPVWRLVKVLYWLIWKKWIALLASAWVFVYFYNQLSPDMQNSLNQNKQWFKEIWLDIDELLKPQTS